MKQLKATIVRLKAKTKYNTDETVKNSKFWKIDVFNKNILT